MENKGKVADRLIFLSGLFILLFISITVLLSSILFVIGGRIYLASAIISIVAAMGALVILTKTEDTKIPFYAILIGIGVILIALFLSSRIYDFTYDGNWYHKSAVGAMANGWNPLYDSFTDYCNEKGFQWLGDSAVWVEHYCKASWIFGANIYIMTGYIETAKCMNILLAYSLFSFAYYYLLTTRFSRWQTIIISLVLSLSPVTTSQLFTFYVDNLLFTTLFGVIICLIFLTDKKGVQDRLFIWIGLACFLMLCINVKFTGLAYAAVFCFAFYVIWLIFAYKNKEFKKILIRSTVFYTAVVCVSVLLVGSSSYLTNFIDHGHPFYPLFGEGKIDIMTNNQPAVFAEMSRFKKLYYSIFSETANYWGAQEPVLKSIFDCSSEELIAMQSAADIRIGGFGPFFALVLILSILVLLGSMVILFIKDKQWFVIVGTLLLSSLLLVCILEDGWWARYAPHLYLPVVLALALAMKGGSCLPKWHFKAMPIIAAVAITVLTMFHTYLSTIYVEKALVITTETREALKEVAQLSEKQTVTLYMPDTFMHGTQFNVQDFDINCVILPGNVPYAQPVYQYFIVQGPITR